MGILRSLYISSIFYLLGVFAYDLFCIFIDLADIILNFFKSQLFYHFFIKNLSIVAIIFTAFIVPYAISLSINGCENYRPRWLSKMVGEELEVLTGKGNPSRGIFKKLPLFIVNLPVEIALLALVFFTSLFEVLKNAKNPKKADQEHISWVFAKHHDFRLKTRNWWRKRYYDAAEWYKPSWVSSILLFIVAGTASFISNILIPRNSYQYLFLGIDEGDMLVVCAILATIVAGLIFFVTTFILNKGLKEGGCVARVSFLWPIFLLTVVLPLCILVFGKYVHFLCVLMILALFLIRSLSNLIQYLTSRSKQEEFKHKYDKEDILESVKYSIMERLSRNILRRQLKKMRRIDLNKFGRPKEKGYYFIKSPDCGHLIDINFNQLRRLLNSAYIFKYAEDVSDVLDGTISSGAFDNDRCDETQKIYLLKSYGDKVLEDSIFTKDQNDILAIPKSIVCEGSLGVVDDAVKAIFIFKKFKKTPSEKFILEVRDLKDSIIISIENNQSEEVGRFCDRYLNIAKIFLEEINKIGGKYSSKLADQEKSNIFEPWKEISVLFSHIYELMDLVSRVSNREIVDKIMYLPSDIAAMAVKVEDHLLFQKSIDLIPCMYRLSIDADDRVKGLIGERSYRHLSEFYRLHIKHKSENTSGDCKDFTIYIIKTFQNLLKEIVDEKDYEFFNKVLDNFNDLFDENNATQEIADAKNLTFFVISAYLLERFGSGAKEHLEKVMRYLKGGTSKLFNIYCLSQQDNEIEKLHRWLQYRKNGLPSSGWVGSGVFNSLFCIKFLKVINDNTNVENIKLPQKGRIPDASFDALKKELENIENNKEKWSFILKEEDFTKIDNLKQILEQYSKKQERQDQQSLIEKEIDLDKVKEFKVEFKKAFNNRNYLRDLFWTNGLFKNASEKSNGKKSKFGLRNIYKKGIFVKDWHVSHSGIGESLGGAVVRSENSNTFKEIFNKVGSVKKILRKDFSKNTINEAINSLRNPVIVWSLEYPDREIVEKIGFINSWGDKFPMELQGIRGCVGAIEVNKKYTPVIQIPCSQKELDKKIIILDRKESILWNQYYLLDDQDDEIFDINILDLSRESEEREKIIGEKSEWLEKEGDKELYLKQQVLIEIYQNFDIEIKDKAKVFCFDVSE